MTSGFVTWPFKSLSDGRLKPGETTTLTVDDLSSTTTLWLTNGSFPDITWSPTNPWIEKWPGPLTIRIVGYS
jgi:hypothetical protein